ncbi:hypothetical protein KVR01_006150 [Diaporthe batatas]|uniref:uncharacterized protein n=1 Tax=Diaporthe batatas TaxID=748121 RepID=UPI001D050D24|nr:uncharacterized protein KVR01_006150 [Diaporthe batatas]KAG8164232.1 hypothetical protein KVR01_006150 [Diaporthe batatas]
MKINPTSQCLSLIIRSLDQIILPELTSKAATSAGAQIKLQLEDLLKRQGEGMMLLRDLIGKGNELAARASTLLEDPFIAHRSTRIILVSRQVGGFDVLAEQHAKLTALIDEACRSLCRLTSTSAEASKLLQEMAIWEWSYYDGMAAVRPKLFEDSDPLSSRERTLQGLHRNNGPPLSEEFLEGFLTQRHGPTKVRSLGFLPGGFGKQTYFSTVTWQDGRTEELVIRKMDPVPIMLHRQFLLDREFDLVSLVHKTGFICPQPMDLGWDVPGVDGNFYTMKRMRGEIPGSFLEGNKEAIPESLLLHCAELLAQLHKTPLKPFQDHIERFDGPGATNDTIEQRMRRHLGSWDKYRAETELLPSPFQTFVFDWLRRNVPRDTRWPVLLHGDFGIHNMLSVGDRITAVLDWECSDFGAPEQDLEWIRPSVSEHMDWARFLAHYHACGGQEVREDVRAFYGMWGMARPFLSLGRATRNLQTGANKDIRYVMCELGFTGAFFKMMLGVIAPKEEQEETPVNRTPKGAGNGAQAKL